MSIRKSTKLISLLLAMLSCIVLACTSVVTVFGEGQTLPTEAEMKNELVESGLYQGNANDLFADANAEVVKAQLEAAYLLALERSRIASEYSDAQLAENAEPASVADIAEIRDDFLAKFVLDGAKLNTSGWQAYLDELGATVVAAEDKMTAIMQEDAQEFATLVSESVNKIVAKYDALLAITNNGGGNENTIVGYYSTAQKQVLTETLNEFVEKDISGEYQLVNPVTYIAKEVKNCENQLDALTTEAIKALERVPKNTIEDAYALYNDWVYLKTCDETTPGYADQMNALVTELKKKANVAISNYENKASDEVKQYYSGEYSNLVDFIENVDGYEHYKPVRVSSITDENKVVTITAKYTNGDLAEVLPDNLNLVIYPTKNSAGKKNATSALKEIDENLSVAYFFSYRVTRNYKKYTFPTKDINDSNRKVVYEITIDLNAYYEKYCKPNEREKDKTTNVEQAIEAVKDIQGASVCYGYKSGAIEAFNFTFEGGILTMELASVSENVVLAGLNLDTWFSSPIMILLIVAALILLWIIIKIIAKHVRYTIKFVSNGGSRVRRVRAAKGEYFTMPADPVKDGYVFAGWYTDKELTHRFVSTHLVRRGGFKLYAKWVCPVESSRLIEMYDALRDTMRSFKKESFKTLLGLTENEMIAIMQFKGDHIVINLALNPDELKKEGVNFTLSKEKKFAEVPVQIKISTEETFEIANNLVGRVLLAKGLQKIEDAEAGAPSTEEERKNGFAYMVHNDRVASTAEDYFELLRIAVKSYVLEEDSGKFKPGDKITLARLYITNEIACLHLPAIKGHKGLKAARNARFEDTPVEVKILAPRDVLDAYALIDEVMKANGFVKNPENANDLADVKVPATNGFAYTLIF